ncbi:MAG: divalent-cation tolerance protein CutA [Planctomycetes bacterium]|nr:divalent-cation tolerance protein CutA [Planctomycetota bacterium]
MDAGAQGAFEGGDRPGAPAVVLVTAPDLAVGRELARTLVEERLVACVNLVPGLTSVYRWEGAVEEASEVLLVMKTVRRRVAELERRVRELHPYDVPEFVVLAPEHTGARYLAWLIAETA